MANPTPRTLPAFFSTRRAALASFDHAYAVACQRRASGEAHQLVISTGDPFRPFRVSTKEPANDEQVLARVA